MARKFRDYEYYWMVTHNGIDTDNAVSLYLLHKALGLNINNEPGRRLIFVPQGTLCQEKAPDNTMVFHADTGEILDPDKGFFDHHFKGCPFYSAGHAVGDYFWGVDIPDDYFGLMQMSIFRDTSGKHGGIHPDEAEVLHEINDTIRRTANTITKLVCVPLYPWPPEFSRRIANLDPAMSDEEKMIWAMNLLEAYVRENAVDLDTKLYVDRQCDEPKFNGLRFLIVPRWVKGAGQLRNYVKRHRLHGRDKIDVIIAEYSFGKYAFSVMMPDEYSVVQGMKNMKNQIVKAQKERGKIYPHPSGHILHIYRPTNLTLADIINLAESTLHRPGHKPAD